MGFNPEIEINELLKSRCPFVTVKYKVILFSHYSHFASNFSVADTISDLMALHLSLACQRPHPERNEVYVHALRRINNDSLEADLNCRNIDIECDDVNVVVAQYDTSLSRLLDKHAPLNKYMYCW